MKDNKKLKIAGIIIAVIVVIVFAFSIGDKDGSNTTTSTGPLSNDPETILANAQKESEAVKEEEKKEFEQIDVTKYLEYYSGSEAKIVLLARPTCTYCSIATPIIQNIMYQYDLTISYLNTDNFTSEDQTNFVSSDEFFKEGFGTPVLLIVKDNSIVDKVDGMTDTAHYIEFFKTNGYIK